MTIDRIIERIVTVPHTTAVQVPVERLIERVVQVPQVKHTEVAVERFNERVVQVPSEKVVEVPVYRAREPARGTSFFPLHFGRFMTRRNYFFLAEGLSQW